MCKKSILKKNMKRHKALCGGPVKSCRSKTINKCTSCDKILSSKQRLVSHREKVHNQVSNEEANLELQSVKCTKCDFSHRKHSVLKVHMSKVHPSGDTFPCVKCNFVCYSDSGLSKHYENVHKIPRSSNANLDVGRSNPACPQPTNHSFSSSPVLSPSYNSVMSHPSSNNTENYPCLPNRRSYPVLASPSLPTSRYIATTVGPNPACSTVPEAAVVNMTSVEPMRTQTVPNYSQVFPAVASPSVSFQSYGFVNPGIQVPYMYNC